MRILSWLISVLLHVAVALLLTASTDVSAPRQERLINVELAEVEPESPASPVESESAPVPAGPPEAMPLDKTIVLSRETVAPGGADTPAAPSVPQPAHPVAAKPISSSVSDLAPDLKGSEDAVTFGSAERRGAGARLGMELYSAFYSYSPDEFAGQFKVEGMHEGENRVVTIIDARESEYGRLLIYDSRRGELRRLRRFNKYIYTIGPSLYEDEPVTGSVTFLAKDDQVERFIYQPEGEKAYFPAKVHFREQKLRIAVSGGTVDGILTLPPEPGQYRGMVLLYGLQCLEPSLVQGAVRALGMRGSAILAFSPLGCPDSGPHGDPALQALAALRTLAGQPEVHNGSIGLLGVGEGCSLAVNAASGSSDAGFVVCIPGSSPVPPLEQVARLTVPSLWVVPAEERVGSFARGLERLRDDLGRPVTLVVDRENRGRVRGSAAEQLAGVAASGHAGVVSAWLARLGKN